MFGRRHGIRILPMLQIVPWSSVGIAEGVERSPHRRGPDHPPFPCQQVAHIGQGPRRRRISMCRRHLVEDGRQAGSARRIELGPPTRSETISQSITPFRGEPILPPPQRFRIDAGEAAGCPQRRGSCEHHQALCPVSHMCIGIMAGHFQDEWFINR